MVRSTVLFIVAIVAFVLVFGGKGSRASCPDITAYRTERAKQLDTKKLAGLWYELAYKVSLLWQRYLRALLM